MAENINIDFIPGRNAPDIQRVALAEDYLKLLTDRTKFCFASVYDDFADMEKRVENLENFSLSMPSSVDLTVENAVILQEKESQQVIHNYTKTHYVKGNNIGYGGIGNDFILGGYLATGEYKPGTTDYLYSEISFPKGQKFTSLNVSYLEETPYTNLKFYVKIFEVQPNTIGYKFAFSSEGEEVFEAVNSFHTAGVCGVGMKYESVKPPDDFFEYGSADIRLYVSYSDASPTAYWDVVKFRLPFQSKAEYNAAVGLTNTPIELIELQDFQYLVPESQIIVDKALSPDSDNVISNSAVAKGLSLKADKETVEDLSLVVDSKADIIEVEALAEIVNSKADSTDVQSIAQTVESKAESSDLTLHTSNTANPHNVTKNQIGLSKVENKSSADILSELEIGGRNLATGTADMTIGSGKNARGHWRSSGAANLENITLSDPPAKGITNALRFQGGGIAQEGCLLQKGETYTCSCWIRSDVADVDIYLQSYYASSSDNNGAYFKTTTEWQRISFVATTRKPLATQNYNICYIYFNIPEGETGYIEVCGFKLEKGNKATAWTPAPEDIVTSAVEDVATGSRNLLLGTSAVTTFTTETEVVNRYIAHKKPTDYFYEQRAVGKWVTISFDYETTATNGSMLANWNINPWAFGGDSIRIAFDSTNQKGHYVNSQQLLQADVDMETTGYLAVVLDNFVGSITISNMKLSFGDKPTGWSYAPEDYTSLEERISALEAAILSLGGET